MWYRSKEWAGGRPVNIGEVERKASLVGGVLLALSSLTSFRRGLLSRALLAATGGYLIYRGKTGYCRAYELLGIDTREAGVRPGQTIRRSITVNLSPDEVYSLWRRLENLPSFMQHVVQVKILDERHSHWTAQVPGGMQLEWDTEIVEDRAPEVLRWRSMPNAMLQSEGSVTMRPAPRDRGTELKLELVYYPPGARLGAAAARLINFVTGLRIEQDLRRFKQMAETGEIATTEGQPAGPPVTQRQR